MTIRNDRKGLAGTVLGLCIAAASVSMPMAGAADVSPGAAPAAEVPSRAQTEQALAEARRKLAEDARQVAELSVNLGNEAGRRVMRFYNGSPRALLGVQITPAAAGAKGATVAAVSPGGAAAEVGIRIGDVITAIGGSELPAGQEATQALVNRMRELQPGLKVKVAVLREGRKLEFEVTPRPAPVMAMGALPGAAPGAGPGPDGPRVLRRFEFRGQPGNVRAAPLPGIDMGPGLNPGFGDGTRFAGMEFATLSERLGSYFGVKSGVLVVRAGADNAWKLQDGDVIVSIDGRAPTSAAHASRILRSYQAGEKVKLRVQRDKRAQDVEVSVAGEERRARGARG